MVIIQSEIVFILKNKINYRLFLLFNSILDTILLTIINIRNITFCSNNVLLFNDALNTFLMIILALKIILIR